MRRMGLKHEGKRCILLMRGTVLNLKLLSIQLIQFGSLLAFWLANKRALDTLLKAASHKSRVVAKKKKIPPSYEAHGVADSVPGIT